MGAETQGPHPLDHVAARPLTRPLPVATLKRVGVFPPHATRRIPPLPLMHTLWITRQDPRPATSGEMIYSLGLIRALAAQDDQRLTVLAHRHPDAVGEVPGVTWRLPAEIGKKSPLCLLSGLPGDAHRLGGPAMRAALAELLGTETFDRVAIDQAACGWALDLLPADLPLLYVAHNHEAAVRAEVAAAYEGSPPMRWAIKRDAALYARLERRIAERAQWISAITPRDRAAFEADFPDKAYLVLSPGYDAAVTDAPDEHGPSITESTPRRVVLAGAFEWIAKRRNLESFLAAAAEPFQAAAIEFHVVGKADPEFFARLARRFPWAEFTANVPAMDPHLRDARIGLIPEALGGGFKLKALDYIFRGLPLASIRSALSGLPLKSGTTALAADTSADLAREIAEKIDDLEFLNAAAAGARDACRGAFDWADRGRDLAAALRREPAPADAAV